MYLITAYFDDVTNRKLQKLIDGIAKSSGNNFMTAHNVPPHLTISAFETRRPDFLLPVMENLRDNIHQGEVQFVSIGVFLPYVMYATPVIDDYLHKMAVKVYDSIARMDSNFYDVSKETVGKDELDNRCDSLSVNVNKYYNPSKWFPHVTLGKTLNEEQIRTAFSYMQSHFVPFTGEIVELGLARTNPHEDIVRVELK